jgi:two-component system response regulator WspF
MPLKIALAHHDSITLETLQQIIAQEADYKVVWISDKSADVIRKCRREQPDILLVDLALANIEGAKLIRDLMQETPCAILILSDSIIRQAGKVFEAMGCGALDAIATPVLHPNGLIEGKDALIKKIATMAKLLGSVAHTARPAPPVYHPGPEQQLPPLIAIGSSTGGPRALATILGALPEKLDAAIVICQHVDLQFAEGLALWLNTQTPLNVSIAREEMRPKAGQVLVAGTNDHLVLGQDRTLHYTDHPRDYPYRPSVNTFFESLKNHWPRKDLAILLTGMGRDGAEGLLALYNSGWHTIVQDEKSSVVYGMPAAAVELGAATEILPLDKIAGTILKTINNKGINHDGK